MMTKPVYSERKYLEEMVSSIICMPNIFRIRMGDGKFIFSILTKDQDTAEYFSVSAIYDTICEIDQRIKYAFSEAISFDLPVTLEYNSFSKPDAAERIALYHAENIVFRISTLWDILAQLCNIIYQTGYEPEKIHYKKYFYDIAKKEKTLDIFKEVEDYLKQEEDRVVNINNPWTGNHIFLSNYRNRMTHRLSPNVSSISQLGFTSRPPTMYILHRAIEDYHMVSSFLCRLINQYLEEHKNWMPLT